MIHVFCGSDFRRDGFKNAASTPHLLHTIPLHFPHSLLMPDAHRTVMANKDVPQLRQISATDRDAITARINALPADSLNLEQDDSEPLEDKLGRSGLSSEAAVAAPIGNTKGGLSQTNP